MGQPQALLAASTVWLSGWSLGLFAAALWEGICAHSAYDLRRSTPDCLRHKGSEVCAEFSVAWCAAPASILSLSPRWLGDAAGMGGPLLTWLPLLLGSSSGGGGGRSEGEVREALRLALTWYLALIGPVRHAHRLMPARWDPSGHIFVYGAQLAPYAHAPLAHLSLPVRGWLAGWAAVLLYLSVQTAAFFHTPGETAAGFALVAALWLACAGCGANAAQPDTEPAAGLRLLSPHGHVARESAQLAVGARALATTAVVWAGSTAAAWMGSAAAEAGTLLGQLGYDGVLWLVLLSLPSATQAAPSRREMAAAADGAALTAAEPSLLAAAAAAGGGGGALRNRVGPLSCSAS